MPDSSSRRRLLVGAACAGFTAVAGCNDVLGELGNEDITASGIESEFEDVVNEWRLGQDRSELLWDKPLAIAARSHSENMAEMGEVTHDDPRGRSLQQRTPPCDAVGENVAGTWINKRVETESGTERHTSDSDVANGLLDQWVNSPGHRRNLLDRQWRVHGLGIYIEDDEVFATHLFCS